MQPQHEINEEEYRAKVACQAAAQGAALGNSEYKPPRKRYFSIRELENGWLVETNNSGGLIGPYEAGKGAYVAKTLAEACQLLQEAA